MTTATDTLLDNLAASLAHEVNRSGAPIQHAYLTRRNVEPTLLNTATPDFLAAAVQHEIAHAVYATNHGNDTISDLIDDLCAAVHAAEPTRTPTWTFASDIIINDI